MKITFLTRYYYPHIGGVEKHSREVAEGLTRRGHKITIITLNHDKKLPELEIKGGVKIIRLPYSNTKFLIWKNLLQKKQLIKQADIIHCHDVFFWYLPFKFLFLKKKVFTTFHGWEGKFPIPKKNIFIRKISEKLSNGNICVGHYIKKYYGTKTQFISYGGCVYLKDDRLSVIIQKNIKQIIFIGRLEKDLGIKEYLKVLNMLKTKYDLKITFVGDGAYKKQAEKIGKVTGMIKDIKPYLKTSSLVFASSYLTILEAMAAGKSVFALYQNDLKKDYLKLFPGVKYMHIASSAKELINQIENNLQGPTLKVKKAQAFAKTQTWDKVIKLYLKLWNQN